ncbi:MAG: hypothetical protein HWE14_08495 [Flavobacteriia bacterium]|nr:hypothetical protein [Flavobacteriia bacterium]
MRALLLIGLFFTSFASLQAQVHGSISYVTDDNVYVRFESTNGLNPGDTLYREGGIACLVVERTSSISVIAKSVNDCNAEVGVQLHFTPDEEVPEEPVETVATSTIVAPEVVANLETPDTVIADEEPSGTSGRGRVSTAAYTVFSPNSAYGGYTRSVTRLALDVNDIANRNLSVSFYGNYQAYFRFDDLPTNYPDAGRAQLYNANVKYSPTENWQLTGGRFINPNTASLGPVDGIQAERKLDQFYVGVIGGFRPDYVTFGTNLNQFQYGVYGGQNWNGENVRTQSTVGLLEQTLNGATDRRFLYLQHSTSFKNGLNLFASSEVDLFENYDTASAQSTFRLTHFYLSANYRINRSWSAFASYDTRQQVVFFETFDNEVEQLLANQGLQNGIRFRLNYRSKGGWIAGAGIHQRFGREDREVQNLNVTIGHSNLPWIGGSLTVRGHLNTSRSLNSEVVSARYSNSFAQSSVRWSIYGRYLNYHYPTYEDVVLPAYWYMGTDWSVTVGDGWQVGLLAEYSLRDRQDVARLNIQLIKRFGWTRE